MQYLTVELPVRLWQRVDGCASNSMAVDVVDAIVETVINGACVRDAGWRSSAAYEGERDQYGWPPQEHLLAITLRSEHWDWILSQLERWEPYVTERTAADAAVRSIIGDALGDA